MEFTGNSVETSCFDEIDTDEHIRAIHWHSEYCCFELLEVNGSVKGLLTSRLDNLYTDKLDGLINEDFWREKYNLWYNEKEELIRRLHNCKLTAGLRKSDRIF